MRNTHQVIVNHICKVVSWKSVILNDDLIIDHTVVKDYLTVHKVFELGLAFWNFHSDYE